MTDMTKRDAVLARFEEVEIFPVEWIQRQRMADHIVELEATVERQDRILAALREPSKSVLQTFLQLFNSDEFAQFSRDGQPVVWRMIHAAVAAAEQEVDRD